MAKKSNAKLWSICMDILRQMYQEATPPANLDTLMALGATKKNNWFFDYYLSDGRQLGIIETHCKANKCNKREREIIKFNVLLGASPRSVKITREGTILGD